MELIGDGFKLIFDKHRTLSEYTFQRKLSKPIRTSISLKYPKGFNAPFTPNNVNNYVLNVTIFELMVVHNINDYIGVCSHLLPFTSYFL